MAKLFVGRAFGHGPGGREKAPGSGADLGVLPHTTGITVGLSPGSPGRKWAACLTRCPAHTRTLLPSAALGNVPHAMPGARTRSAAVCGSRLRYTGKRLRPNQRLSLSSLLNPPHL